jgi:uncharacterized membrane protein
VLLVFAFLIGISAGLRSMTAPAAVCWAARLGRLKLAGTPLALAGAAATPWILSAGALFELFADKSSWIPSRKSPPSFAARIVAGAFCGLALGASGRTLGEGIGAAAAGVAGALVGTLGGYEFRARLARAAGALPAALLEDVVAIGLAICSVWK